MLILLPPSETKAAGGTGGPLDTAALSFPGLTPVREALIDDLGALDVDTAMQVLGVRESLRTEVEADRELRRSPTMPALLRYTGVLYDALDAPSLTREDPDAWSRLAVGSALFGILRAGDMIPRYRLSSAVKVPVRGAAPGASAPTLRKRWGGLITAAVEATPDGRGQGVVVDLRSGGYRALGKVPGAVTVRVESVRPDGGRKVVSHFNKHYKGVLARVLATAGTDAESARTAHDVARIAAGAGLRVETSTPDSPASSRNELTLVV